MPPLPRTVKTLGAVSLLTDMSSEMIYPLLPSFLVGPLKAGPAFVGLVEGIAESVASLTRLVAGRISDRLPRRKPLIVAGYGLSSLMRPLVALAAAPWHVLAIRTADRIGKGVRGAPRDALLAEVTPAEDLGRAYGFHRAMDHVGAVAGPLIASGLLLWRQDLRLVFALAAVPALASVLVLVFGVREARREIPARTGGDDPCRAAAAAAPAVPVRRRRLHPRQLVRRLPAAARAAGRGRAADDPAAVGRAARREVLGQHGRGRARATASAGAR